jgi:antitoxin ParD1/3/4
MASDIDLGPELDGFIEKLIADGRFPDRRTAIKAAVRTFRKQVALEPSFDAEIQKGIDSALNEPLIPAEQVFADLQARLRRMDSRHAA